MTSSDSDIIALISRAAQIDTDIGKRFAVGNRADEGPMSASINDGSCNMTILPITERPSLS